MSVKIIQQRLEGYRCTSQQEEEFALKEITQELTLYALYNMNFFKKVAFQGGTALRIHHHLNRFSEDLDFALIDSSSSFELAPYLTSIQEELSAYGYTIEIEDRSSTNRTVQNAFLKEDSIGRLLNLSYQKRDGKSKRLKIKVELDTNPPLGAKLETLFHDFPLHFSICVHDLPSLFAGKSHALLCRQFIKGRDWFDFLWYASRKTPINFAFLSNALNQLGPWKGKKVKVNIGWYKAKLSKKIHSIDWEKARIDVQRFLRPTDTKSLKLWSKEFFGHVLEEYCS